MFVGRIKLLTSQEKPLSILTEPSIFKKQVSDASLVKMLGEVVFFLFFPRFRSLWKLVGAEICFASAQLGLNDIPGKN